ncbi:Transposase, IS4 [Nostoc flagelliforme CCNUN1]|uniref:Transposase, IS4 n=1 Tax=Nostoc flagelliforme CCNUN1 TaxID=2038116 RepID=A0A2K8T5J9_9NOSO|nr:Transposase, IS4 [Nostoc flagelliforme CCNUN1]
MTPTRRLFKHPLKIFKILSDRYRNRHRRFGLRSNLIAGVYNHELAL